MSRRNNSLGPIILPLASAVLQGFGASFWLLKYNLALAALIAASGFLTFPLILFTSLASFWILNWIPGLSIEAVAFVSIPILFHLVAKFFHSQGHLGAGLWSGLGLILFYLATNIKSLWANIGSLILECLVVVAFAILCYEIYERSSD